VATSLLRTVPAAMAALVTVAACGSTRQSASPPATPPAAAPAPPAALVAQARPIGRGPGFQTAARGPVPGSCDRRLGPRAGVHVEVFAANRVVLLPAGIGTRPPRTVSGGRITSAGCYGDLVTLDPTGLVLVRAGLHAVLGDVFRAWGQPLSTRRLAAFSASAGARVAVFVNGRRWHGLPEHVPLALHSEIVLEVGPYVPPHRFYTFPPGT
jgi:hypothetical protein